MNNDAFINGISFYLPSEVLDNNTINLLHPEWSADKISSKTGIYQRHIASVDESASDMAIKAANNLFKEYHISPNDIDFILYCTQSPDYILPTTACILQDKLGIPNSSGALDFNLGCSGYVYGLSLAKGLICSGLSKNVLLLTSETYSKYINSNDKSNKTIFGDAASATLISNTGEYKLQNFIFGTDGKGAENLIIKNGLGKYKDEVGVDQYDENNNYYKNDSFLYMNGAEIFSFTSNSVPILVNQVLEKNELNLNQVDYFIFHQANKFMLDFIRKKIGIPNEKFILHLESVGNTVSSTIPLAIKAKNNIFKKNNKILLAGFGVGYSWAGCIIEKCNN